MTIKRNIIFCSLLVTGAHICAMDDFDAVRRKDKLAWEKHLLESGETKEEYTHRMVEFQKAWYLAEHNLMLELGMTREEFSSYKAECIVSKQVERYKNMHLAMEAQEKAQKK